MLGETTAFVERVQQQFASTGCWNMETLENGLRAALLKDGCRILEALLNQRGALGTYRPVGQLHENRTRQVQSLLGGFELRRGYYQTDENGYFPMDTLLGLSESYTPGLAKLMCRCAGMDGSYEEASETLQLYAGVTVPASQIRKMVQTVGPALAAWNQSTQRQESRCAAVPVLYLACDGTGVPMRKEETQGRKGKAPDGSSATRKIKLGCVFTSQGVNAEGEPVRDPDSTSYIASFHPSEEVGALLRHEAVLRGIAKAQRTVFLGDGAAWVWNVARINFPTAIPILDFYHAREHLGILAQALWPQQEIATCRVDPWVGRLLKDEILKIIAQAQKTLPHHGSRRETALREIEYFQANAPRMQYGTFKKHGYFIGSGVVEAGCKTVVGKRTKQSGMFWRVDGAQNVLNIRCSVLSRTYDRYWLYHRQQQLASLAVAA